MKTKLQKIGILIAIVLLFTHFGYAQLNGFELTPSGNTENYMKYIRKAVSVNGTSYYTGYLTLSPFRNVSTGAYYNDITPFQKLQIQGGNILLCSGNGPGAITDINPTSRNGAILFSDWASDNATNKHGKWGIEYDNQYSTGGLNFFKPVSQLTSTRINFNLFISNAGNIGVGIGDPSQKLDIDGNIRLRNNGIIGTWSNHSLTFNTNNLARMVIASNGNIGIGGSASPQARLHINSSGGKAADILLEGTGKGIGAGIYFIDGMANIGTLDKEDISFYTSGTTNMRMKITSDGRVGIGVSSPQQKLHVAGGAKFDNQVLIDAGGLYVNGEVKAKRFHASISPFPDFVFEPDYKLLSINEVESYIIKNGHLPGLPSAASVEENGIELGEMNAMLLQKIEELTLYIIAQEKKIQALEAVVNTKD